MPVSGEGDTEFGDCTIMIEDEAVTASQQVENIGLEIRCDINEQDYEEIHSFQVWFTLYGNPSLQNHKEILHSKISVN